MYRANFTCGYSFKVYGCYSQEEKFCVIKSRSGGSSLKMRWWQWRGADTYCGNPMGNQRSRGRDVTPCDRHSRAGGLHPGRAHHRRHLQQQLQLLLPARQRDSSTNTDRGSNLACLRLERSPGDKLCAAMISHAGSAQI